METSTDGWVIVNENHPNNPIPNIVDSTFSTKRTKSIQLFTEGSGNSWEYWKRKWNFKCVRAKATITTV